MAGYKVKCMLAEPKGKRGRQETASGETSSPATSASRGAPLSSHPRQEQRSFSGSLHSSESFDRRHLAHRVHKVDSDQAMAVLECLSVLPHFAGSGICANG